MTTIEYLTDYILNYSLEQTPVKIQEQATLHILDTIGVMQAGIGEPSWQHVLDFVRQFGGHGNSVLFGTQGSYAAPADAAMVNAIAAHTLDFDDMTPAFFGHPGIAAIPAMLSFCDKPGISGRAFLEAFITGAEVCGAVGAGIDWASYGDHWVSTSCIGILGGVAACAKLIGMRRETLSAALSIAAGEFSGLTGNYGTSAKDLNAGRGAAKAVFSVQSAQLGFAGSPFALEAYFTASHANFSAEKMIGALTGPSLFETPGVAMKLYPVCGSALCGIEAALQLYEQGLRPLDLSILRCRLPDAGMLDTVAPADPQAGKFSLAYCICLALCKGAVDIDDFNAEADLQQDALQLMPRLSAEQEDSLQLEKAGIELAAYREQDCLTVRVEAAAGDPSNPLSLEDVRKKFITCAERRMSTQKAENLFLRLRALSDLPDIWQVVKDL